MNPKIVQQKYPANSVGYSFLFLAGYIQSLPRIDKNNDSLFLEDIYHLKYFDI